MADAPLACSGDSTRDGVESSRAVASTADKLRTLADWLDAHPSAVVSVVTAYGDPWVVHSFAAYTVEEMDKMSRALDPGEWVFQRDEYGSRLTRKIVPGIRFEFFLSRSKAEDVAA